MCAKEIVRKPGMGGRFPMRRQGTFVEPERIVGANGDTMMKVVLDKIFSTVERNPEIKDPKRLGVISRMRETTVERALDNFDKINGEYVAKKPKDPELKN